MPKIDAKFVEDLLSNIHIKCSYCVNEMLDYAIMDEQSISIEACKICQEETREENYDNGFEKGKQEGYDDGYEEGKQEGYDDGYSKCEEEMSEECNCEDYKKDNNYDLGYEEGYADGQKSTF